MKRQRLEDIMVSQTFSSTQHTSLDRKGSYRNYCKTRNKYEQGECAFCVDNGLEPGDNKIIFQSKHWVIWEAPARLRPESHQNGLNRHLMVVPKKHIENFFDMSWRQWMNLWTILWWTKKRFTLKDFFMFCRSGDPLPTGATELHFCFQIKVADRSNPDRKRMVEVFSKTKDEEGANVARGTRFGVLYEDEITPDQFDQMVADGDVSKDGRMLG